MNYDAGIDKSSTSKLGSSRRPYCLLVEDNPMALMVLESLMSHAGCRVKSAKSGEEAFDLMRLTVFDLVITDVSLPGMSGPELTTKIRSWEKEHNLSPQPIIGLTGHERESAYDLCVESGMNDVFTKPIDLELIHHLIKTFLLDKSSPYQAKP
jgi:two-component system, OmpR family, aerobic respiration control sensor histidine kinase ArcB